MRPLHQQPARARRRLVTALVAPVLACGMTTACAGGPGVSPAGSAQPPTAATVAEVEVVASGLDIPWGLAFLPDGTPLVTERDSGRIVSLDPDGGITVRHVVAEATGRGEGGLLGLAVSPTYDMDELVYIYYTTDSDNRVARLRFGHAPEPILTGIPSFLFDNGGRIAFGPDGMLYVATGDTEERSLAQDPESLAGKILRITPDGRPAPGNPVPDSPMYSLGHRNVQGLAWDGSGRLFATEMGDRAFDEVNLIEAGGNYGWPAVEGVGNDPTFVDPVATLTPSQASPSGIAIIGDRAYLACLRGRRLASIALDGSGQVDLLADEYGRLRTVQVGPGGDLWITTSNRDGRLRGRPDPDDDRVLRVTLGPAESTRDAAQ